MGTAAPGTADRAPKPGVGAASVAPLADTRSIAYTGQLAVRAADVGKAAAEAKRLATNARGYPADEYTSTGAEGGAPTTRLTLKVPPTAYEGLMDQLAALGTVLSRTSQAQDLTQQMIDVDSRLKSQQASVDRVRALMAQAGSLSDVVSLEGELSRREADLESLQRQQQEMTAQTSLSTVTLELSSQGAPAARPAKHPGFPHELGGALAGGWNVLASVARGALIVLAALAPFLLLLTPLAWAAWRLRRRRILRRPAEVAVETPAEAAVETLAAE
ncbi:hypothetical protein GCM10009760_24810 [Kitasatospora kazusensis]|uniref:DUF4349 domain-containing protein n=2 Tax=Kitasatospora kazusensis TaxID=407974 RepID=A0ABN2ZEK6_9ACTN